MQEYHIYIQLYAMSYSHPNDHQQKDHIKNIFFKKEVKYALLLIIYSFKNICEHNVRQRRLAFLIK